MTAEERSARLDAARDTARRIWHSGASIEKYALAIADAEHAGALAERERLRALLRAEAERLGFLSDPTLWLRGDALKWFADQL